MKARKKLSSKVWTLISLLIILIGFIGASVIQTDFGKVEVTELKFETQSGLTMSGLLLVPNTATAENPAPCIVTVHGWYNNKEMQDLNFVEYSRRGYVVLAIDQYGHGDSDNIDVGFDAVTGNGLYDAVKMVAELPYVDTDRIGVTGHSYGAESCKSAVARDNETEDQLIAACLLVSADSNYTVNNPMYNAPRCVYDVYSDPDGFYNFWESRDVGIVAAQYDEFYHGYPADNAAGSTAPRDYIHQPTAQSFLYFGIDPEGKEERNAYTFYTENIDGRDAFHVIFNPPIIHPWAHFSASVVESSLEFFDRALDTPIDIDYSNQIWQIKTVFNTLSFIGFFMFVVNFSLTLLNTKTFSNLRAEGTVTSMEKPRGIGKFWYWGGMALAALFGMVLYLNLHDPIQNLYPNLYNSNYHGYSPFFSQFPTLFIGLWSALCGLFLLIILVCSHKTYGKKNGFSLTQRGVRLPARKLWKTLLMSLVVVITAYGIVFIGDWLMKSDCRLWVLTIRAFDASKIGVILKYFLFFAIYFIAQSLSVNCFNDIKGKKKWTNLLIQCLSVVAGPLILVILQYGWFVSTGFMFTEMFHICGSIVGIWLIPLLVYLPLSVVVSRSIYKRTNNPYLGGLIMALIITVINCTNTMTFA